MEPETLLFIYKGFLAIAVFLLVYYSGLYLLTLVTKFVNLYIDKQINRCNKILSQSEKLNSNEISIMKAIIKYFESLKIKERK